MLYLVFFSKLLVWHALHIHSSGEPKIFMARSSIYNAHKKKAVWSWNDIKDHGRGGTTQLSWKMKTLGGGIAKVNKRYLGGGSLQWSNIHRGDRLHFILFSPKSFAPPLPIASTPLYAQQTTNAQLRSQFCLLDRLVILNEDRILLSNN